MSIWRILLMVPVAYWGSLLVVAVLFWAATGFPIGMAGLNDALHTFTQGHVLTVNDIIEQAAMLGIAWLFMRRFMSFKDIGLGYIAWRDLGWGALLFVGGFLVSYEAELAMHATNAMSVLDFIYALHAPWWEIPAVSIAWGLGGGIVFRGYVLQGLMRGWPSLTWLAVVVSGLLFAVPHVISGMGTTNGLTTALMGMILALPVALRKGIWPSIIGEIMWDAFSLALLWAHLH